MLRPSRPRPYSDRRTQPISLLTARTCTYDKPWSLRRWLNGAEGTAAEGVLRLRSPTSRRTRGAVRQPVARVRPSPHLSARLGPNHRRAVRYGAVGARPGRGPRRGPRGAVEPPPGRSLPCRLVRALWRPAVSAVGPRPHRSLAPAGRGGPGDPGPTQPAHQLTRTAFPEQIWV